LSSSPGSVSFLLPAMLAGLDFVTLACIIPSILMNDRVSGVFLELPPPRFRDEKSVRIRCILSFLIQQRHGRGEKKHDARHGLSNQAMRDYQMAQFDP
jgi:hypothetical protein